MSRSLSRRTSAVALIGALALSMAGCGGDDASDKAPSSSNGDNDPGTAPGADGADLPEICDLVTAEEVGEVLGATVALEPGPSGADCEFSIPDDVRGYSGTLGALSVDTGNGGFDALQSGAGAVMDDPADHDVDVADGGFVTTGTVFGGENLQSSGGALVGGVAYTATVIQGSGHSEEEMVAITQQLLELVVGKIS